jgi:hypothetical protein
MRATLGSDPTGRASDPAESGLLGRPRGEASRQPVAHRPSVPREASRANLVSTPESVPRPEHRPSVPMH